VQVCITYDEGDVQGSEESLELFHYIEPNWIEVSPVVIDQENNTICGEVVWLSPFIVAECMFQCPFQSDFDEDGFLTALDLSAMIDILFGGEPDVQDPACPSPRADFDCDGFSTALDMSGLIDHLFSGGDGPCDPCFP
jgi:hypothetical protein